MVSLVLISMWLQLFWMVRMSTMFGRFVLFTVKVAHDVGSILGKG